MNIGFIGLGKLGLPCALAIESKGHIVCGFDVDPNVKDIIDNKKIPYEEEGAQELLDKSNIKFQDMKSVVRDSKIIFVPIQTPHDPLYEGITRIPPTRVDFDYMALKRGMMDLSNEIDRQGKDKIVIIISTVLPGTTEREILPLLSPHVKVCYNPFFIAMGTTVEDFLYPEFILFGVDDDEAAATAETFYKTINNAPFYKTSIKNAELIKVGYNTFIGMKIVFANTLMEICHKIGANVDEVTDGIKMGNKRIISPLYFSGGMGDGGCLDANQQIYTSNGLEKICNISTGEKVLAHDGKLHKVNHTFRREYSGDLIKIKALGIPGIALTPNHKVLSAKYIGNGKDVVRNNLSDISYVRADQLTDKHFLLFPKLQKNAVLIERPKHANDYYVELAGYYLSEGHIAKSNRSMCRLGFTFNTAETEDINRVIFLLDKLYPGIHFNVSVKKSHDSATDIIVFKKHLVDKLLNDFGKGAKHKRLPGWILYGNEKTVKLILKGVFRGDGCSDKKGFWLTTISENLCFGVDFILKRLGILSRTRVQKSKRKNINDLYQVMVHSGCDMKRMKKITSMPIKKTAKIGLKRLFDNEEFVFHRINNTEREYFDGFVYNIEVDEANSYVPMVAVSNSCHPRDNIALSWLARETNLSHDWFDDLMTARENQTDWLADLMEEHSLPKVILGKAFKPNINLTVGSPSILLKNLLEERGHVVEMYDPYIDEELPEFAPSVFLIGTKHPEFVNFQFPEGSVVIDPWRYIPKDLENVTVIRLGE
jgi:UDP-glucose 6-dehydrogenase